MGWEVDAYPRTIAPGEVLALGVPAFEVNTPEGAYQRDLLRKRLLYRGWHYSEMRHPSTRETHCTFEWQCRGTVQQSKYTGHHADADEAFLQAAYAAVLAMQKNAGT